jgi:hypothetical protein
MIMDLPAEGWYKDPYEQHEDRWFSGGLPTKLVRDAGAESYAEPPYDKARARRAVWDVMDQSWTA